MKCTALLIILFFICRIAQAQEPAVLRSASDTEHPASNRVYMRKIALYDKLIQKNPNDLGASYYKARCYLDMKEYTKAVESFNECLKHDSYLATRNKADKTGKGCAAWCYQNLAYIYFLKGDYRNGIKVVSQAIELRPAYPLNYKNRGMAYLKLGRQELAQRDFARMNELIRAPEPDDFRVLCFDHKPPF